MKIPTTGTPWPVEDVRRISINSFGFGGTNAHVVLDDAYHYLHDRGIQGNHCTVASPHRSSDALIPVAGDGAVDRTTHPSITDSNKNKHCNGNSNVVVRHSNGIVTHDERPNGHATTHNDANCNGHSNGGSEYSRHIDSQWTGGDTNTEHEFRLLVWSAADEKALERTIKKQQAFYKDHIAGDSSMLNKLACTLASRRSRMLWRTSAIVSGKSSAHSTLSVSKAVRSSSSGESRLAFVFTGQGAQHTGMSCGLVSEYPLFAETLRRIDQVYSNLGCKWKLLDELQSIENINKPEYSQPLSTAVQLALVELLKSFGIVPHTVIGHSSGEIAAAYAIGALSLESACSVSYFRGRLAGKLRESASPAGAMISVNLAEKQVSAYLEKLGVADAEVTIACVNSPLNCTLSGPERAIDDIKEQADKDSIFAQKLKTGVAYHSPTMLAIVDEYKQHMGRLEAATDQALSTTMISTVTGKPVDPAILAEPQYWVDNMVSPVLFSGAVTVLTKQSFPSRSGSQGSITDIIEVGPTAALRRPIADILAAAGPRAQEMRYSSVLYRSRNAVETTMELAGQLYSSGHLVSIDAVNQIDRKGPFLVNCPEYPFDHSNKYWAESRISRDYRLRGAVSGETLGSRVMDWNPLQPRWRNFLTIEAEPWLADHNVRAASLQSFFDERPLRRVSYITSPAPYGF